MPLFFATKETEIRDSACIMTLDIIVWAPEVFFLLRLLVLVWYGSGPLDTPVREKVFILQKIGVHSVDFPDKFMNQKGSKPVSGPLHI